MHLRRIVVEAGFRTRLSPRCIGNRSARGGTQIPMIDTIPNATRGPLRGEIHQDFRWREHDVIP